jgi:predicted dehydrogenase
MVQSSLTRRSFLGAAASASLLGGRSANDRMAIGLIGTGGRGQSHVRDLVRLKDRNIAITAICDVYRPNREKAAALAEQGFGIKPKTTTNYKELLSWKDVDAVVIAAPDFTHSVMLKAGVEAGKDVYVEKPFGTVFSEAKAAYLAVKKGKQVVQVGTQKRSEGNFVAAAAQVRSGVLGKVTRVEMAVNFQEPRWRRANEKIDPADVDWKMFQLDGRITRGFDQRLLREWQLFPETTNGIPGLWMSHFIDLVPWYLDDPYPAGAVANGGVFLWKDGRKTSDVFYTLLDYPKEFLVSFSMTLTNTAGSRNLWCGTRGTLDAEKWTISGEGSREKDKIQSESKIAPEEKISSHMENFLECVRSRQTPRADVQAGFSHAVAGIMSSEALARGRRVRLDRDKLELV